LPSYHNSSIVVGLDHRAVQAARASVDLAPKADSGVEAIELRSVCVNDGASKGHRAVIVRVRANATTVVARAMVSDVVHHALMVQVTRLEAHKPARPRPR